MGRKGPVKSKIVLGRTNPARKVAPDLSGKLSAKIWNIDWHNYFPHALCDDQYHAEMADYAVAMAFMKEQHHLIYSRPQSGDLSTKETYYQNQGDFICIKKGEQVVGLFTGTINDWSTYYFRNISIVPEHQGKKILQNLMDHLLNILTRHKIERVEADISNSNLGQIHLMNKMQFMITGIIPSDRWGLQVRFTKFLNQENHKVFLKQFCY